MMDINIGDLIRSKCPGLSLGCVECRVTTEPSGAELLTLIDEATEVISGRLELEDISALEKIRSTREAYKKLGKKPGRYRPSAEALLRRTVSGKGLYRINNVVDLVNYLSITTHYSIGGYDADHISGNPVLDIGRENEPYPAIARGQLNIGRLPCLRDDLGAFGTPTSDSERTRVRQETTNFLLVFYNFGGHSGMDAVCEQSLQLLEKYCRGRQGEWKVI